MNIDEKASGIDHGGWRAVWDAMGVSSKAFNKILEQLSAHGR
ncbi:hypothetical protein [Azohydromonas lata]|nr:hypothetical protein [Azohydromonas lata]